MPLHPDTIHFLALISATSEHPKEPSLIQYLPDNKAKEFSDYWFVWKDRLPYLIERFQNDGFGIGVQLWQCRYRAVKSRISQVKTLSTAFVAVLCIDIDDGRTDVPIIPGLPPTMIVKTKRGMHVYWAINKTRDWQIWEATQKGLSYKFNTDPACTNVSAIMRLPGTYHLKTKKPFLIEILEYHPERIYDLADFSEFATIEGHRMAKEIPEDLELSDLYAGFKFLNDIASKAYEKVKRARVGSRTDTLRRTAWYLGLYTAYADEPWRNRCAKHLIDIAARWQDKDQAHLEWKIRRCLYDGYRRGQVVPPDMPGSIARHQNQKERSEFLASLNNHDLGPTAFPSLIGTPEQRALFDSDRSASYHIAARLVELDREQTTCWHDGKSRKAYVFKANSKNLTKSA